LDNPNPKYLELVPSTGSIPSNRVSRSVFAANVDLSPSNGHRASTSVLLDLGANSCFMDREFSLAHKIILQKISHPISVSVIDGCCIAFGDILEENQFE
jgi:hypothetical protein